METDIDASGAVYKTTFSMKEVAPAIRPGMIRALIDAQIDHASHSPNSTRQVRLITNGKITSRLNLTILRSLKGDPNNTNNNSSTGKEIIESFVGLAEEADEFVIWQRPEIE